MCKYSWDINILDIPFGWADVYSEALVNSPNGRFEVLIFSDYDEIKAEKVWYDPVKYKETIITTYSHVSELAKDIFNNKDLRNGENLSSLIKYDAILIELIFLWNENIIEVDSFNPNNLTLEKLSQHTSQSYLSECMNEDTTDYLSSLGIKRFISISL